ncbi:uncharacterized protein AlacWU_03252 [Aspergillus niger]|nr:uncharacterized protein AlacWU_03252 [Aspergillus niger]
MRRCSLLMNGSCYSYRGVVLPSSRPVFRWYQKPPRRLNVAIRTAVTSTTDDTHVFQYQPIEDVEKLERYRRGGYHPIYVGGMLNNRYNVIDKLGHGTFSTIWLSRDEQKAACVVVKVSAGDDPIHEAKILRMLTDCCLAHTNGRPLIPVILDGFEIEGPDGNRQCIVTIYAQGYVHGGTSFQSRISMNSLGNRVNDIPPDEAQLLSDFGESFSPSDPEQRRRGQDCPSPLPVVPPEAYCEPDNLFHSPRISGVLHVP